MKILLSEYAGACYGVERALALAGAAVGGGGQSPVYTLGSLIHNPRVVADLKARGVAVVDRVDDVDAGILIIRSHGVAPQIIVEAQERGLEVIDATCPHVLKAQCAARDLCERGALVIVVGESGHPEVEGISAHAGENVLVVQTPADVPDDVPAIEVGVVVQTTQSPEALAAIVNELRQRGIEPDVRDTICSATLQRQQAAASLARTVDCMLVVGGHNSGNTTRLYEICKAICPRSYHIESPEEIDPAWFKLNPAGVELAVGITAGASTPQEQITRVTEALKNSNITGI